VAGTHDPRLRTYRRAGRDRAGPRHGAERLGSLDSAIAAGSAVVNDFPAFFAEQSGIHSTFFNGAKAEALFRRLALPALPPACADLRLRRLPSASPANARVHWDDKLRAWTAVAVSLGRP